MILNKKSLNDIVKESMSKYGDLNGGYCTKIIRCVDGEDAHKVMTLNVKTGVGRSYDSKSYPGVKIVVSTVSSTLTVIYIDRTHISQMSVDGEAQMISDCLSEVGYWAYIYDSGLAMKKTVPLYKDCGYPVYRILQEINEMLFGGDSRNTVKVFKGGKSVESDDKEVNIIGWIDNGQTCCHCITADYEYFKLPKGSRYEAK